MDASSYQPLDLQVSQYLHPSSPQNLRKSGDMWGFSAENNQPVRSFDDPYCLICPIDHIGWAQVNIGAAILNCWGRTRHLPDPRPDLVEFQEQTKDKHLIEFINRHVQMEWERGKWSLRNWKDMETLPPSWIQPEETLLSALIRPPSRPEPIETQDSARLSYRPPQDNLTQEQAMVRQEWPHPNTTTMVEYLKRMNWKTPFIRRLRLISIQWKMTIDSLECEDFDFSAYC